MRYILQKLKAITVGVPPVMFMKPGFSLWETREGAKDGEARKVLLLGNINNYNEYFALRWKLKRTENNAARNVARYQPNCCTNSAWN